MNCVNYNSKSLQSNKLANLFEKSKINRYLEINLANQRVNLHICRNSSSTGKNKLFEAFTKNNSTLTPLLIVSLALTLITAKNFAFTLVSNSSNIDTNIDLQKTIWLVLKLFVKDQKYGQINSASGNKVFKT